MEDSCQELGPLDPVMSDRAARGVASSIGRMSRRLRRSQLGRPRHDPPRSAAAGAGRRGGGALDVDAAGGELTHLRRIAMCNM